MNKKILGILTVFALLVIGMSYGVSAAPCTASSCTPTCKFTFPPSDNYDLLTDEFEGNTTMVVGVTEDTTSDFENITQITISPYRNATTVQNTSQFGTSVTYSDLDDGVYTLNAIIFYDNASAEFQNLTATQVSCSSRQFTVDTSEGSIVPLIALTEDIDKPFSLTQGVGLVILLGAIWLFFFKKSS